MTDTLDGIGARIASGESLAEIRRSLRPSAWEPLLKACAAAVTFDRELFDGLLRPYGGADAPTLDQLAALGAVEEVPHEPGRHRLLPDDRTVYMQTWLTGWTGGPAPDDLAALERRLADHAAAAGDRREQLRHLLVADTPQGLQLFDVLFGEADRNRDFARCQDLLDVLGDPDRRTVSGPDAARVLLDRSGYLRAQSYWAVDYARCAQYLAPTGLRERADALMGDHGSRVWQVFASPGMGKTMQLRWLVTRYCVPAERDIPCARIDFDAVSPVAIGRHPWLALLEAAAQFDNRWLERPFGKLDAYGSLRSLLRRPSDLSRTTADSLRTQNIDELRSEIVEIFVSRFNAAAGAEPALLVCDTMEELLRRGQQDTGRFLELLGRVRKCCPSLRLVLAGRYDLTERVPQAREALEGSERVEVEPFTDEQAERYLRQIRGITDAGKRAVARRRANGRPLTLAIYADAIEQDTDMTAEGLAQVPEPIMPLLIERVVHRIEEPAVRWLVRYGVVPRKLRREDLPVMLPFLSNMGGPTPDDDPRKDLHGVADSDAYPFAEPPSDDAALENTWQRLLHYAGSSSWVSQAPGDPSTVIFHPDILAPQRLLLSRQRVFTLLHRAFAQHFEALAAQYPDRWADFTREAVYHRFQMQDERAAERWRAALRQARQTDALDELHALATEVLGRDYLDEQGEPRRTRQGKALISYTELIEAHLQEAYAISRQALRDQASPSDPRWREVEYSLSQADRLRGLPLSAVSVTSRENALRALLLTVNGRAEEATSLATRALAEAMPDERADVLRVLGDSRAAVGDPSARDAYQEAYELTGREGRTGQAHEISLALAREREAQGQLQEALDWCERAEPQSGSATGTDPATLTRARLLLTCYRPAAALRILPPQALAEAGPVAHGDISDARVTTLLLTARAELMLGQGSRALATLDAALSVAAEILGATRYRLEAQIHQLRAVVMGELLEVDDAEALFRQAESMWAEFGYRTGHPECLYLHARFLLREVGDLTETGDLLAVADRRPGPPAGQWDPPEAEFTLRTILLGREMAREAGYRLEGNTRDADVPKPIPPRHTAILAVHRLVAAWWRNRQSIPALAEALETLQPPSARLFVMEDLRRCPTPRNPSKAVVEPLRRVLPSTDDVDDPQDQALHRMLLAELDRLAGRRDSARRALDEAVDLMEEGDPLAQWRWVQARSRLGVPVEGDHPVQVTAARSPLLRSAILLRLAADARRDRDGTTARRLVEEAVEAASQVHRPTRWGAEALRAYAEITDDEEAHRAASRVYKRLGLPHRVAPPGPAGLGTLEQESAQLPITLSAPEGMPLDDPDALQRLLVHDLEAVARVLHEALTVSVPEIPDQSGFRVLRMESDDPLVHALPWEWALAGLGRPDSAVPVIGFRTRPALADAGASLRIQAALRETVDPQLPVDGFLGPRTREAVARLTGQVYAGLTAAELAALDLSRRRARKDRPSVALVAPSPAVQYESRGSHYQSGVDLADLYASRGFDIRLTESVDIRRPCRCSPSLIHVSAPLETTAREPYFDLSAPYSDYRWATKSQGFDLSAAALAQWLRNSPACLVVLDPPLPGSPLDIPEQLLGRNIFAAQLLAELPAAAILGIGLSESHTYPSVDILATAIRDGLPLSEAFELLVRRRLMSTGHESLAVGSTTLFTAPATYATCVLS
ncbi:hypothetical protein ABZZ79_32020 [Streptomyces sp. NPDC006458]|uniref:hypothetical protein n=1 Tax=Streptomyces sp. NPDC006458 TaxID=3154302 RepID=UPI0033BA3137